MRSRHWIVHPPHGAVGISAAAFEGAGPAFRGDGTGPVRVALLYGDPGQRRDGSIDTLEAVLAGGGEVVGTSGLLGRGGTGLRWEILRRSSCIVLYGAWPKSASRWLGRIERLGRRGWGVLIVGLGESPWAAPVERLAGACPVGQHPSDWFPQIVPDRDAGPHPLLEGVAPFPSPVVLTRYRIVPGPTQVLLRGTLDQLEEPVAWARVFHRGRVVCTSLGQPEDLRQPGCQRFLQNALRWVADREVPPGR